MSGFKRVCLVAPDGWSARLAMGMQKRFPQCEIAIVSSEMKYPELQGIATVNTMTDNLFEGLRRADLVLIARHNASQIWNLRETISGCEQGTTICEFGRPVSEALRLIREFNRDDVHYVSIGFTGLLDQYKPASTCVEDLYGQRLVGLTPSSIEDLQPFSLLHEVLRSLGAEVSAYSPQQHDRRLADVAYMPRLAMLPVVRFWCESSDVLDARAALLSTAMLEYLGGMSRREQAEWVEEVTVCKTDVLSALDAYQGYLQMLRQEIETDKLGNSMSQLMRQVGELRTMPEIASAPTAEAVTGKPSVERVLGMLNNVWQTLEQLEQNIGESETTPNLDMVRELLARTRSCLQETKPLAMTAQAPAAEVQAPEPVAEIIKPAPVPMPEPLPAYEPPVSAPVALHEEAVEVLVAEQDEMVYEPTWSPDESYAVEEPVAPAPVEDRKSHGRELWLDCGNNVQVFASAARVLAEARVGIEGVERMTNDGNVTVKILLTDEAQSEWAMSLLTDAGIHIV
ncbi:MAG: prephenate dehydrogenase/arogenate dehydrogenase family protein [bacterium]|nr:prephenate dehydrogenase/arogenate dehydrogenase family protein [bacterium]